MPSLIKHDGVLQGVLLAACSEVLTAALLYVGLLVAGQPIGEHIRWFAICFVPPILLLRHFAKRKEFPIVTKSLIIVLFVTFVAFMFLLFRTKAIAL